MRHDVIAPRDKLNAMPFTRFGVSVFHRCGLYQRYGRKIEGVREEIERCN
jgi:hypothetical protein